MTVQLPLEKMSLAEKLQAMEQIWDDLARNVPDYRPPDWHQSVLEERQRQLEAGEIGWTDWNRAKAEIRRRLT